METTVSRSIESLLFCVFEGGPDPGRSLTGHRQMSINCRSGLNENYANVQKTLGEECVEKQQLYLEFSRSLADSIPINVRSSVF